MLRIVRTKLGARESAELEREIAKAVEEKKTGYLIVPEQDTVMRESAAARSLPDDAPLYFEVTNFTRLANTTFRALGGLAGEYCDNRKRSLIMWQALSELSPHLSLTSNQKDVNAGLVERAMSAIGDLRSAGITPSELSEIDKNCDTIADKRLRAKLSDLEKIYALYKKMLTERYSDTGDDYDVMIERLRLHPDFLVGAEIFIDGFNSFTEPQYKLIGLLAGRARVSVYLPLPKGKEVAFVYTGVASAVSDLKLAARRASADVQIKFDSESTGTPELIYEISDNLWGKTATIDNSSLQNADTLRIFEATSPFEMCDFVAADIKRKVMQGASYSDFAIVARRAENYRGMIDTSLSDGDIPGFISFGKDAGEFEAIKLIYTAYSTVRSGFAREDVITYAKCGLVGISRDECDEFEMYVNTWRISGATFTTSDPWNMNPHGYESTIKNDVPEKLCRINETRDKLISPLLAFKESISVASTVKEHAEALLSFLLSLGLEELLYDRARKLSILGETEQAEDNTRLWGLICDTLDTLVEVGGDRPASAEVFLGQFKLLIGNESIGRIPSYTDRVTVGSADMLRLRDKKHVYVIGLNAGELPSATGDSAYFSERDKARLVTLGLPIFPEAEKLNARELFIISRAICYATESVTLLYSRTNNRFKAIEPSPVIDKIVEMTQRTVSPIKISSLPVLDKIYSAEAALRISAKAAAAEYPSIRAALRNNGHGGRLTIGEGDITNGNMSLGEELCRELYSGKMSLSQSKLDKFLSCPMSYFCKYTVGISDEITAEFDASKIGSFIHSILEHFFIGLNKNGLSAEALSADEKEELTMKAARQYIASIGEDEKSSSTLTGIKLRRLCRAALPVVDGLCEELSQGSFKPSFFELRISDSASDSPEPLRIVTDEGREVSIGGIIDRVDTFERDGKIYVRVLDYKTGTKSFSPTDMEEGKNLQMFLYLDSILSSDNERFKERLGGADKELVPAGVIYVKTSVADANIQHSDDELAKQAVKDAQQREGMILNDDEIISAMGLRYTPLYNPKKPNVISDNKRKFLFTPDGYDAIMETVRCSVGKMADGIASGNASASPRIEARKSPCEWCEFKPICRKVAQ